ncbi:M81 family metallopeptidase [Ponticoccus alexandrii]|uniref:Microcystinase C n=1 Tax=Ponticoccus alexandrii TaxID=1943633 RepID=A0ABX7FJ01_9RHOB|nr:M81 family metallopeptidase [Ponticoccus alexandrii]ETA49434.1 microcystin LR degradation protein MlrC-like protein [Rhodobacteraceae bacterium PD-2]QRF69312.1 microcystin LR degradation protein MlrC-like protein [Ponticoccus alexandrii]
MRVFCASVGFEANTFSPLRTDFNDFAQSFYAPPGQHPETPTLCSAVFPALRRRARAGEIALIEGTATWAEPGGLCNAATWARLRDEILGQLREALPVDAVVLGLHGAMIAEGTVDCEGVLVAAVREMVGPDVKIGVSFDPHSHLSAARTDNADVVIAFKEFPHTDFVETGEAVVELTLRAARGEVTPQVSVYDVRMMDVLPTSIQPMRGFVDEMMALEGTGRVLAVSAIHGFMAGDSPDLGAKIVVVTDNDRAGGDALAERLGRRLFEMRGQTRPEFLTLAQGIERATALASKDRSGPVVVADIWDNPGGGTAGDSTIVLKGFLEAGVTSCAFGTIWDPMAVRLCHAAGTGATLDLRFGSKTSATAGDPIDATVQVVQVQKDAVQSFGTSVVPLGDIAVIRVQGIEVVLNSNRSQAFSPDLFGNAGVDPMSKDILVIKSTNHFYGAFAPIASDVLYVAVDGPYPNDPATNPYTRLTRPLWPRVENPHAVSEPAL